jgi:hypothetical protein
MQRQQPGRQLQRLQRQQVLLLLLMAAVACRGKQLELPSRHCVLTAADLVVLIQPASSAEVLVPAAMAACTALLLLQQLLLARRLLVPLLLQAANIGKAPAMRSLRQAAAARVALTVAASVRRGMSAGALAQQVLPQHAESMRVKMAVQGQAAAAAAGSTAPAVALPVDKCLLWLQNLR